MEDLHQQSMGIPGGLRGQGGQPLRRQGSGNARHQGIEDVVAGKNSARIFRNRLLHDLLFRSGW
jgi:hypothetical protein